METTEGPCVSKVSPLTESFYREDDASSQERNNVQVSVSLDEDQSITEEPEDSLPINNNKLVHQHPKYILSDENNGTQRVYARLVGVGHELDHLMMKPRIVIGRNSSKGNVDINMGHSNFISRNHLEINYTNGHFYLSCGGKNGVFVEDHFQKIGAPPLHLPKMCTLRFPSTQIMIRFSAMDSDDLMTSPPLSSVPHQSIGGLHVRIPSSRPSFFSPCPSPTGTISAVNSAPASPNSNSNGAAMFSIINRRVTAPSSSKDDRIPVAGENDDIKPPYSYAQLIVQAISSAPDKQMTLSGIYSYISRNYSYYRAHDKGWQNSIRHNLSLNRYFIKIARSQEEPGKGCFWRIDSVSEPKLVAQAFRRRNKRGVPYFRGTPSALSTQSAPASPTRSSADDSLASPEPQTLTSSVTQPMSVITSSLMPHVLNDIRTIQSAPGSPQGYKILSPSIITSGKDLKSVINLYQPTSTAVVTTEQPAVTSKNSEQPAQSGEKVVVLPAELPVQLLTANNSHSIIVNEEITSNSDIPTTIKHEESVNDQDSEVPVKRTRFDDQ